MKRRHWAPLAYWARISLPQMANVSHAIAIFINYILLISQVHGQGWQSNVGSSASNVFQPSLSTAKSDKPRFFHSDERCLQDINVYSREDYVTVSLQKYGTIVGRIAFLCDLPGVPERERPPSNYANSPFSSSNIYSRPIHPTRIHSNVSIFLGIPYARPPTKESNRRFKDPSPPDHWGHIEAAEFGPSCPQPKKFTGQQYKIDRIDENCLYMNIYSPHIEHPPRTKFPVMIYIHDGMFEHGSGNVFPGHMLSASQEVVVVTFNYRLGPLGFFATAENSSAGNYGMLDQVQAIKFVRENILSFNGDPDRITLFGSGSGAASAGLLALSPLTSRFIKGVIASSGSPLSDWAIHRDFYLVKNNSIIASYRYGCRHTSQSKLVECLNSRSFQDFSMEPVTPDVGWLTWAPVMDNTTRPLGLQFLPRTPESLILNLSPDFAYMTGVTRDDGATILMSDNEIRSVNYEPDRDMFDRKVNAYIKILNATRNPSAFLDALKFMYGPYYDPNNVTLLRKGLIDMYTDSWYLTGVDKMTKQLINSGNRRTYMYVLNYTITAFARPEWAGVPHDTEYFLASGAPFMDPRWYPDTFRLKDIKWTDADRNMSQFFMESWANLAKTGNPTPKALFNTILWQPMASKSLQYLSVNTTNYTSVMHYDYRQKFCQFWSSYLPSLAMRPPVYWPLEVDAKQDELRIYRAAMWAVTAVLILLIFLTVLCSCLYCRAKRDRWGDAAIDDHLPNLDKISVQYSAPSTRANSETSLRSLSRSRDRVDFTPMISTTPSATSVKHSSNRRSSASPHERESQQILHQQSSHHRVSRHGQTVHPSALKNGRTNASAVINELISIQAPRRPNTSV